MDQVEQAPRTWRKCGHERTPENTAKVTAKKPGGQCRACVYAGNARYRQTAKGQAAQRAGYARYAEHYKQKARERYYENRDRRLEQAGCYQRTTAGRATHSAANWRYFGIVDMTWERFEQMNAEQDGRCYICGGLPKGRTRLDVDHDHATGEARKLLCGVCNRNVAAVEAGRLSERHATYARCAAYVREHQEPVAA